MTEDRVNIEELLFILKNYDKRITSEGITIINDYYFYRNYPWFIEIKGDLS